MGAQMRSHLVKCSVNENHRAAVTKIIHFGDGYWITADAVGQLKVWDGHNRRLRCLWTSLQEFGKPCDQLAADDRLGVIVASFHGGEIGIWSGIDLDVNGWHANVRTNPIPPFIEAATHLDESRGPDPILIIDPASTRSRIILLFGGYRSTLAQFSKLEISLTETDLDVRHTVYSDCVEAALLAVAPSFKAAIDETDFVISGDLIGAVSVWNWGKTSNQGTVGSLKSWVAHGDGGISEIEVGDSIFVTGRFVDHSRPGLPS